MVSAVIDTNVFVSAFLTRHEDSATIRVLRAMGSGVFVPLYNEEILAEYQGVLSRKKFGLSADIVEALIDKVRLMGACIEPKDSDEAFPDPDDKVFYCVALAKADEGAKLVTGNARHYPASAIVISPAQFCELIGV